MSEKYFNAYVDAAVGSIHEYVALTLQLKAQIKVANDLLAEKERLSASDQSGIDAIVNEKDAAIRDMQMRMDDMLNQKDAHIVQLTNELNVVRSERSQSSSTLENEINNLRNRLHEIDTWKEKARVAEESMLGLSNKVTHMDTLTKQYGELKSQLIDVSKKYDVAQARIAELETEIKSPKKVINTKSSSTKTTGNKSKELETDDF